MALNATRATMLGLIVVPMLVTASLAEPPDAAGGRFTMSPVDGGFLRLDKQTGAVAMCAKSGNDWACKPVNDQTPGNAGNLAGLEAENRELKSRVKELEDLVETRPVSPPSLDGPLAEGPPGGKAQLPTDEEVDQALDYLSRVYKKVRDHIRDLDKPIQPDEHSGPPGTPAPAPPSGATPKGSL
jgi:hypothetical protein